MIDKKIFLWRHAPAESYSLSGRDRDRKLSPEGVDALRKAVKTFKEKMDAADIIFSSPYLRAKETSEIIQSLILTPGGVQIADELESGTSAPIVLELIIKKMEIVNSAIFVGHVPDLNNISALLLGRPEGLSFRAAGLAKLTLESIDPPHRCKLHYFFNPD